MLAKFFEKPGDYEQLRHAHGDPAKPADEVDLLRAGRPEELTAAQLEERWDGRRWRRGRS